MLWSVRFDQCLDEALQAQYRALLSPDELLRLSRFVFERDRHRHLVSRALVRVVLGRRLGIDASALAFGATPQGKPTLTSPPHAGLTFNLTHSGNRAILAISQGLDVGVDVEAIKHKAAPIEIGHRQFAPF